MDLARLQASLTPEEQVALKEYGPLRKVYYPASDLEKMRHFPMINLTVHGGWGVIGMIFMMENLMGSLMVPLFGRGGKTKSIVVFCWFAVVSTLLAILTFIVLRILHRGRARSVRLEIHEKGLVLCDKTSWAVHAPLNETLDLSIEPIGDDGHGALWVGDQKIGTFLHADTLFEEISQLALGRNDPKVATLCRLSDLNKIDSLGKLLETHRPVPFCTEAPWLTLFSRPDLALAAAGLFVLFLVVSLTWYLSGTAPSLGEWLQHLTVAATVCIASNFARSETKAIRIYEKGVAFWHHGRLSKVTLPDPSSGSFDNPIIVRDVEQDGEFIYVAHAGIFRNGRRIIEQVAKFLPEEITENEAAEVRMEEMH